MLVFITIYLCLKKSESLRTLPLCLYILRRSPLRDYVSGTNENKHIPYSSGAWGSVVVKALRY